MQTVYDYIINTLTMATFKITPKTTVAKLKEQYRNEVGGTLRIYSGRSEADDGAALVSLGAKEGVLECRTSRTVGSFEKAFQDELGLKVKVYTKDNWVKVLDGTTLESASKLPNGMTKAKMEEYVSNYSKSGKAVNEEKTTEKKEENPEDVNLEIFEVDDKYGLKDSKGNIVVEPIYDRIKRKELGMFPAQRDEKWGFLDSKGNQITPCNYDEINMEVFGLIPVKQDEKWGFINKEGKVVINFQFDDTGFPAYDDDSQLIPVSINDKWGMINTNGEIVIDIVYDWNYNFKFSNGVAIIEVDGKCGAINTKGEIIIAPKYDSIDGFDDNGIASMKLYRKHGFINKDGVVLVEPQFDDTYGESEGLGCVKVDGLWGYVDMETGELAIEPQFDYAECFSGGEADVELDDESFKIDKEGNRID